MGEEKFIGSYEASVDKAGRLKIPERFRSLLEGKYGPRLFITSFENESVRIFPLPVWEELTGTSEIQLAFIRSSYRDFFLNAHSRGCLGEIDARGRVLIPPRLREKTELGNGVKVVGMNNYLEVWSVERLETRLDQHPLTGDDVDRFASLGPVRKPE
jgi:MraZ protein